MAERAALDLRWFRFEIRPKPAAKLSGGGAIGKEEKWGGGGGLELRTGHARRELWWRRDSGKSKVKVSTEGACDVPPRV
ncbi:hypothetical protein OROMI_016391 [Orobanche minor]